MNDYENALTKAGAIVHCFNSFGSYQGDWWAKVTWQGNTGWINGSYGSYSACDSFQAEFGYEQEGCEKHGYSSDESCPDCIELKLKMDERIFNFGKMYLEDALLTQEKAEEKASEFIDWDMDAKEVLEFLKSNKL